MLTAAKVSQKSEHFEATVHVLNVGIYVKHANIQQSGIITRAIDTIVMKIESIQVRCK